MFVLCLGGTIMISSVLVYCVVMIWQNTQDRHVLAKNKCIWCSCFHPTVMMLCIIFCQEINCRSEKSRIIVVCSFLVFSHAQHFL